MNMVQHPLVKTTQDVRRSISRLKAYLRTNNHLTVEEIAAIKKLIGQLEEAHQSVPEAYRDADLVKGN